jgi:hypothetical protein
MTINAVAELYSSAGYIRTVSDSTAVKRISEITNLVTSSSIEKIAEKEESADTPVNNSGNNIAYDFRFMPNIPLARSLETGKTFNETEKANKQEESEKSFDYYLGEEVDVEESVPQKSDTGKGYYIVLGGQTPQSERKSSFNALELLHERIMNTYYPGRMRDNGTLVNLTF